MQPVYEQNNTKKLLIIAGTIILVIGFGWLIKFFFFEKTPSFKNTEANFDGPVNVAYPVQTAQQDLLMKDEVLHTNLSYLQQLDIKFMTLLENDKAAPTEILAVNQLIDSAETAFNTRIDSVARMAGSFSNPTDEKTFTGMITSFRLSLDNRRSVKNLRKAIGDNKGYLNADERARLSSGSEMLAKDTRIAILENELYTLRNKMAVTQANEKNAPASQTTSQRSDAENEKLAYISNLNHALQKELDRVRKQMAEPQKNNEETTFKTQRLALNREIDQLNAELRLAQVDCNLTRVDAAQIISNSKQRKTLLSEALNILNGLSGTDDENIQKKVQEKTARLNQVARNYRD